MDFGVLGLEGLVGPETSSEAPSHVSPPETKPKILGSVLSKRERSASSAQDDYWRTSKMPKNDDFSVTKTMSLHQPTSLLRSNYMLSDDSRQQEHMMSFSSPRPETTPFLSKDGELVERSTQNNTALSFRYHQNTASSYIRSAGKYISSSSVLLSGLKFLFFFLLNLVHGFRLVFDFDEGFPGNDRF
jgi:hypothetical protein